MYGAEAALAVVAAFLGARKAKLVRRNPASNEVCGSDLTGTDFHRATVIDDHR